jgi:hypothetical protein
MGRRKELTLEMGRIQDEEDGIRSAHVPAAPWAPSA